MTDLADRLRAQAQTAFENSERAGSRTVAYWLRLRTCLIEAAERIEAIDAARPDDPCPLPVYRAPDGMRHVIPLDAPHPLRNRGVTHQPTPFLPNVTGEQYEIDRKRLTDYGKDGGF